MTAITSTSKKCKRDANDILRNTLSQRGTATDALQAMPSPQQKPQRMLRCWAADLDSGGS